MSAPISEATVSSSQGVFIGYSAASQRQSQGYSAAILAISLAIRDTVTMDLAW